MKNRFRVLFIPIMFFVLASISLSAENEAFQLITADEAAAPDLDPSSWHAEASRGDDGPSIQVLSPQMGSSMKAPVIIDVKFLKKDGRDIDLSTLKVEYLKFLTIDLTPRVKNYVSKEGIKVPNANLPSGSHTIRLSIGDVTGAVTKQVFTFEVL